MIKELLCSVSNSSKLDLVLLTKGGGIGLSFGIEREAGQERRRDMINSDEREKIKI